MPKRDLENIPFWRLNAAAWTAFAVGMALSRVGQYPIGYMVATKTTMGVLAFASSGLLLRPFYRRFLGNEAGLVRVIALTTAASYSVAALWTAVYAIADIHIQRALLRPNNGIRHLSELFDGALYNTFALLAWSLLYVAIKHQQALRHERERTLRAEAIANQARLDSLRWQLNPHFLFNALNGISTLVVDNRATEAAAMIARLGDLLRSTLELPPGPEISLAAEMELVSRYLDIEQMRLGDRLTLVVRVEQGAYNAQVPPMLLQPIVENAIRHAVAPRVRGGCVSITAQREGDRLHIAVEDDGPGMPPHHGAATNGSGIGLTNTKARLAALYGGQHEFALENSQYGGLCVRFNLPFHE